MIRALGLLAILVLSSCAGYLDRVSYFEMRPRLEYQGFSFERPPNPYWYLRLSEEDQTHVTLRRELDPASPTHTFYALVSLGKIEKQPASPEEFAELARSRGQIAPYESTRVSYTQNLTTKQNQWCIQFASVDVVRGAPIAPDRELTLVVRGYRCLHPAFPSTTLDFFYSERGLPDELDVKLYEEGERFLEGVRIDIAPHTPAA